MTTNETSKEDVELFSEYKKESLRLSSFVIRFETTITLLEKRGFDTTSAQKSLDETKALFVEIKELIQIPETKKSTLEENMKKARSLLSETLKEIRLSLSSK